MRNAPQRPDEVTEDWGTVPRNRMTTATRQEVLGLYRSIFRLARKWQATSGQMEDTIREKQYILNEARTLFRKNKNLTDTDLIKQCIDECTARIEIGLHYKIPYPRPIHLPPMGLTPLRGRGLRSQEKLRKLSKPVYLRSHDEVS
ncbi:LYR motif-containing protein 1 isoform X2 [Sapajus apella]|nr:LYR motif-containing protein 1 isoform X2 [Sapajus apella]